MVETLIPAAPDRCLVDTNVISYLFRRSPSAEAYRPYLAGKELGISFQTLAEPRRWSLVRDWGSARWSRLIRLLEPVTVYLVDEITILTWADVTAQRERLGRPMADGDAWIAATALVQGVPLVTHNRRHFDSIAGLTVVSFAPDATP